MNINEQAVHDLVTRQIDLMRYERSVRRDVLQQLAAMQAEVEARLRQRDLDTLTRREMAALLADIETILARDYDLISGSLQTQQAEVAEAESDWLFWWLGGLAAAYGLQQAAKPLLDTQKRALARDTLIGGLTLAEAWQRQRDDLMARLKAQIRMDAVNQAGSDIRLAFNRAVNNAKATTATWISAIGNQAVYLAGQVNPLVKGYGHVSVLDSKTSTVCASRHGKRWNKRKQPLGHDFAFRPPPIHPHCRSKLVWLFDLKAGFVDVSGTDWVQGRTLQQLQEQFGAGVGKMLHDGTISLHDAVRQGGLVPMTLDELRKKYAKAK